MRGLGLGALRSIREWMEALVPQTDDAKAQAHQQRLEAEPWAIDALTMRGDMLWIAGWAFPPPTQPERARFLWNDQPFDEQEYPTVRPDLGEFFAQRQNAERSGFACNAKRASRDDWFDDGCLHLRFEVDGSPVRHAFQYDWFYPDERGYPPLPDPDRMYRVMGTKSDTQFLLGGFSDFNKFRRLLMTLGFGDLLSGKRVLDWGVGCGRVGRYFSASPGVDFVGIDIDADNVEWCSQHLRGRFFRVPLRPPIPADAGSFDVIYGISVLTHLRETDQRAWLEELHRLAAPGAMLLLTFHGTTAANYAGLSPPRLSRYLRRIERKGFLVTGRNRQIKGFIDEAGYYVNVAHSKDYVRRVWGEYFEVLDIIPGMIATHDLAVLRKR